MGKKSRIDTDASTPLENNALAGLGALMADVPDGDPAPAPEQAAEPANAEPRLGSKLVVRREKKGRGGKAATIIEGLTLDAGELDALARRIRKDLGCGAHVEGSNIVLQGAQTDRTRTWLLERGAKKVIVGN